MSLVTVRSLERQDLYSDEDINIVEDLRSRSRFFSSKFQIVTKSSFAYGCFYLLITFKYTNLFFNSFIGNTCF